VTFSDAAAIKTIDLATTVHPGKMTFTNTGNTNDYIVTGAGGLAGAGEGLVKNGDGWLDLGSRKKVRPLEKKACPTTPSFPSCPHAPATPQGPYFPPGRVLPLRFAGRGPAVRPRGRGER
jgi:hypothetical protein